MDISLFTRRTSLLQLERGLHGLEPLFVANFPTKKYSDEYFSSMRNSQYVPPSIQSLISLVFMIFQENPYHFNVKLNDFINERRETCDCMLYLWENDELAMSWSCS